MTREFELLLRLYSCAAKGKTYTGELSEADEAKIISLAALGGCTGTVMLAVSEHGVKSGKRNEAAEWCVKKILIESCAKNEGIKALFTSFDEAGIQAFLLKGQAVAEYYRIPECRQSSDTDILIKPSDEDRACELMRKLGYSVTPRTSYSHHATAQSESTGTVELHTSLFFEMLNDVLFDGCDITELMCEPCVDVTEGSGKKAYTTLGYTDHLIFLTLHMIQHFVRSGTSVRQLFDILIYTSANRDKINFERYNGLVKKLGYSELMNTVYSFGVRYFDFSKEELPDFVQVSDGLTERFASDIEKGGWIGKNRYDGEALFRYYGQTKANDKTKYAKYVKRLQREKMKTSLFPDRERLISHFPFAKHTALVPVAWICWLFYGVKLYFRGDLKSDVSSKGLDEEQKNRLKLFSDLGI